MDDKVAFIGFGEAGRAFAVRGAAAYDRKTDAPETRPAMLAAYAAAGVKGAEDAAGALAGAQVVMSLVTADQAVAVAEAYAPHLSRGALWLDMNSVSPAAKRRAAAAVEAAGGRYVDVAVMAPVLPARRAVPLLAAGPHAEAAVSALAALGFSRAAGAGDEIGQAAAIKMIRSVMIKGLEALSAECALAAAEAGVTDAVIAALDASWREQGWAGRFDYNLDRMLAHGTRRAAEMDEVAATLEELGIAPAMSRAAAGWQRSIGITGAGVPEGLDAKLAAITARKPARAA